MRLVGIHKCITMNYTKGSDRFSCCHDGLSSLGVSVGSLLSWGGTCFVIIPERKDEMWFFLHGGTCICAALLWSKYKVAYQIYISLFSVAFKQVKKKKHWQIVKPGFGIVKLINLMAFVGVHTFHCAPFLVNHKDTRAWWKVMNLKQENGWHSTLTDIWRILSL